LRCLERVSNQLTYGTGPTCLGGLGLQVNKTIVENPALVNESPEDKAWFVKFELTAADETKQLLDESSYKKHCEEAANHH